MESLSGELRAIIVQYCENPELKSLRQSCKAFYGPATHRLFSHIHVTLDPTDPLEHLGSEDDEDEEGDGGGEWKEDHYRNFNSILSSPELVAEVESVRITTCEDPNKDLDECSDGELVLTEHFEASISSISRFPNLRDVFLEQSQACAVGEPDSGWDPEETVSYRYDVLRTLFVALSQTPKLRSLTLKHLQDYNDERLLSDPNFTSVLSRLSELKLKIVTQYESAAPESSWRLPHLYTSFSTLPSTWLAPTQANLTSLTIHCDKYWGYLPLCDFRSLHFPKLKRLELGNYTFTHDWQLEWILSHCDTLEELVMDDCSIINYIYGYGQLDAENYPLNPAQDHNEVHMWSYERSWAELFAKIETMPNLKVFSFGSGDWDEGLNFEEGVWKMMGMHEETYQAFDRGTGPSPWLKVEDMVRYCQDRPMNEARWPENPVYRMRDCLEEDTAAYERLMRTVGDRR